MSDTTETTSSGLADIFDTPGTQAETKSDEKTTQDKKDFLSDDKDEKSQKTDDKEKQEEAGAEEKDEDFLDDKEKDGPDLEPLTAEAFSELLPDDLSVDDETRDKFLSAINDSPNRAEMTTKLLEMYQTSLSAAQNAPINAYNEMVNGWKEELLADPELGKENANETKSRVNDVIRQHGGQDVRDLLKMTGLANNKHFIGFLTRIAEALPKEARPTMPGSQTSTNASDPFASLFDHPTSKQ